MARRYPPKDIKILWGRSAGRCNFPDCQKLCIYPKTEFDDIANIGKIAHIYAHSPQGPRANENMDSKELDCYSNWILLCSNHHDLVDKQPNTYTAQDLFEWKHNHEQWVNTQLRKEIINVTFSELDLITKAISNTPSAPVTDFDITSPSIKLKKNNLTENTHSLITLGLGKSEEVKSFIINVSQFDPKFPERLKAGFIEQYDKDKQKGLNGDALFESLFDFASGYSSEFRQRAAGLAVLVYLFQLCEVFEK
jgi:hypothetical protein